MAKAATSEALRVGSGKHLEQTNRHMQRLDNRLSSLGEKSNGEKCKGMEGLIEEGQEVIEEEELEGEALDAGIESAAEPVEHYEIAAYGCVRTYANLLGETKAVFLLEETLKEKETDERLTDLAESINAEAAGSGELEGGENPGTTRKRKAARA